MLHLQCSVCNRLLFNFYDWIEQELRVFLPHARKRRRHWQQLSGQRS
jgi:hypothetical protein